MSDNLLKHLIALCGSLVALLAYIAGYQSGQEGWWWTSLSLVIIYVAIVKLVDV